MPSFGNKLRKLGFRCGTHSTASCLVGSVVGAAVSRRTCFLRCGLMTGEQSGVVLLVVDDASQRETDTVDDDIIEEDDDDDDVVLTEQHVDESS